MPVNRAEEVKATKQYIDKFFNKTLTMPEWKKALRFKWFRINTMYHIKTKDGDKVLIKPNFAQEVFYINSHQNDIILKARQLGFTTFKMIYDLDDCLFKKNYSAGCIAHNAKDALDIYRNKIKFAYETVNASVIKLLEMIGYLFPTPVNDKSNGYVFTNGSSIGVSTGYRGGTLQSLHISEFGKICKKYPDKAKEIVTGAFNSVGKNCTKTIESTAEGKQGYFYDYCATAKKLKDQGKDPASLQFKFHFFSWWMDPEYFIDEDVHIPERLTTYFNKLESKYDVKLTEPQKKWYTLIESDQGEDMKREYPSTPEEAFEQAVEGAYYANQFADIYKDGRIVEDLVKYDNKGDVHTVCDIGIGDSTAIWFWRNVGDEKHILHYHENSGEPLGYYIKYIQDKLTKHGWDNGINWGPHDMNNREFASKGKTRKELAREGVEYGDKKYSMKFDIVPKLGIDDGIQLSRDTLPLCVFDEDECDQGIKALENYRKEWNDKLGCWRDKPLHDWSSHGADAFRYLSVAESKRKVKSTVKFGLGI
jgi:hypothetical protein